MKCLAGMLAALWVAAAQSQTPAPDQPLKAEQTPTVEQTAAAAVAHQVATAAASLPTSASLLDGAAPAVAQQAATAAASPPTSASPPDGAAPVVAHQAAAAPAAAQAPELTAGSHALVQTGAEAVAPAPASADVAQATSYLKSAAADFTNCRRASACYVYFDTFGVAIPFADGSIVPFSHVQRLTATSRECIKKAKALEEEGNRSLAVQWAMAARIENKSVRDWLGNHPDAVLAALRQVPVL